MHELRIEPASTSASERWRAHIAAQRRSGLSVRAYCAGRDLKPPTFYEWRRRLAGRPAFLPVHVAAPSAGSGVEILLARGHRLRLARGFDVEVLRDAVAALEEARPC